MTPDLTSGVVVKLGHGVALRLKGLAQAIERLDALETAHNNEPTSAADREVAARQVLRKALQAAADPCTYGLLRAACQSDGMTLESAARHIGGGRLAAMDRLYDLVQAGLASGSVGLETVHATAAGHAVVDLVEGSVAEAVALAGPSGKTHA